MNVNMKFGRFKQWAGEKMGGEVKTSTSTDFQALESEMGLRYDGAERLQKSMSLYVKALAKKSEGDETNKMLPSGHLGAVMVGHGQDFSADSDYGQALTSFGRANEAIARRQEGYTTNVTSIWLESLERSLAQMKEYQAARKKLETRRLAYDASLVKMQKTKKEDFRAEEELRAQKAKYEESNEDVYRRMRDIQDGEVESLADLTQFLEAELEYHETCRNVLLQLRRSWPEPIAPQSDYRKPATRPRAMTASSHRSDRAEKALASSEDEEGDPTPRPSIAKVSRHSSVAARPAEPSRSSKPNVHPARSSSFLRDLDTRGGSEYHAHSHYDRSPTSYSHSSRDTDDTGHTARSRDYSPDRATSSSNATVATTNTDASSIWTRTPLRTLSRVHTAPISPPDSDEGYPMRGVTAAAAVTPIGPGILKHRTTSPPLSGGAKKNPPPPPPSRAKKPAPPPPMKRMALSAVVVPQVGGDHY